MHWTYTYAPRYLFDGCTTLDEAILRVEQLADRLEAVKALGSAATVQVNAETFHLHAIAQDEATGQALAKIFG